MSEPKSPHFARGRHLAEALQSLNRDLHAHRGHPLSAERAGEVHIRAFEVSGVDPNCGWIAEATWVPKPTA